VPAFHEVSKTHSSTSSLINGSSDALLSLWVLWLTRSFQSTRSDFYSLLYLKVPPFTFFDMLSSLPTELIREIIESTVPHTFHSTTYTERQKTLRSLTLVSKLFHSIAQPLLLEIVGFKRYYSTNFLDVHGSSATKVLMLGYTPEAPRLDILLQCFVGLRTLSIQRDDGNLLDLNRLCDFPRKSE
jgi:hypothetical protein